MTFHCEAFSGRQLDHLNMNYTLKYDVLAYITIIYIYIYDYNIYIVIIYIYIYIYIYKYTFYATIHSCYEMK